MGRAAGRARKWLSYLPALVLLFFLALAFAYQESQDARAAVGQAAPAFSLESLDGGEASLDDFRGRPVVVNFWTTWCVECRAEVAGLQAFHEAYGGRVAVLGVNMREPQSVIRPYLESLGADYPVLLDRDRRVARAYGVTGVPETWIVGPDGVALQHFIGPVTKAQLVQALRRHGLLGAEGE